MNERELIGKISSRLGALPPGVVVGIGDDTALLRVDAGSEILVTTDSQREGIHYRFDWITPEEVGYRLVMVNASDVLSKGGTPLSAFVTLAIPATTEDPVISGLYDGILAACQLVGAYLSGGDISRTTGGLDAMMTMIGTVPKGGFLPRGGLTPGDLVYAIGRPGIARAGFLSLSRDLQDPSLDLAKSIFRRPRVFSFFPGWIRQYPFLTASMDSSDGLGQALLAMARASGVLISLFPDPDLSYLAGCSRALSVPDTTLALEGGEDYDLVVGVPKEKSRVFEQLIREQLAEPLDQVTCWGEVVAKEGTGGIISNGMSDPDSWGFDHVRD